MALLKTWPSLHLQQVCWYVGRTGGRSIHLIVRLLTYDESREGRTDCDHRGRATRWGREAAAVGGQEGARKDCSGSTHHFQFFPSLFPVRGDGDAAHPHPVRTSDRAHAELGGRKGGGGSYCLLCRLDV